MRELYVRAQQVRAALEGAGARLAGWSVETPSGAYKITGPACYLHRPPTSLVVTLPPAMLNRLQKALADSVKLTSSFFVDGVEEPYLPAEVGELTLVEMQRLLDTAYDLDAQFAVFDPTCQRVVPAQVWVEVRATYGYLRYVVPDDVAHNIQLAWHNACKARLLRFEQDGARLQPA